MSTRTDYKKDKERYGGSVALICVAFFSIAANLAHYCISTVRYAYALFFEPKDSFMDFVNVIREYLGDSDVFLSVLNIGIAFVIVGIFVIMRPFPQSDNKHLRVAMIPLLYSLLSRAFAFALTFFAAPNATAIIVFAFVIVSAATLIALCVMTARMRNQSA